MSYLYPRERVEAALRSLHPTVLHRILLKSLSAEPLSTRPSPSRFCDGHSFSVLYAAEEFATAFIETVVRDRFVHKGERIIGYDELQVRSCVMLRAANALNFIDLRGSGAVGLGAPTDAAQARNHSAGRALARGVYEQHVDIDGFAYESRFTGGSCFAIFDRALAKLGIESTCDLSLHPQLPEVFRKYDFVLTN